MQEEVRCIFRVNRSALIKEKIMIAANVTPSNIEGALCKVAVKGSNKKDGNSYKDRLLDNKVSCIDSWRLGNKEELALR